MLYTLQMKNKLSQEPTYIHVQATCYRLTECKQNKVFFSASSFAGRLHFAIRKKGPIILLFISKGNLLRKLRIITNLNVCIWKTVSSTLNPQGAYPLISSFLFGCLFNFRKLRAEMSTRNKSSSTHPSKSVSNSQTVIVLVCL